MSETGASARAFTIEAGLRPAHRRIAAAGYWEAFSRKLRYPLEPEAKAVGLLERVLRPEQAVSALAPDGRFLGVAGFKTPEGAFLEGGLREMAETYGWFRGLVRGLLLQVLDRPCDASTLLMDGIFVRPEARSLGVGSALLDAVEAVAVTRGLQRIRLDVIDENPRARALYARRGFEAMATVSSGLLKPVFGFRSATTMIKAVA